ncbi:hypothetical protein D8674_001759 [Pyrus ussuriensis x Pyrus communis]|uniref:Uncharacterized protein n=1 Tax=Pyrus ussuriensis x Pyrus communis TaxID=2448454 RepID=A0A5N5F702_9ROSA|nr:hypothetical protein D8674_001759 [Pyrus ussuriensis x Pyrus communis]
MGETGIDVRVINQPSSTPSRVKKKKRATTQKSPQKAPPSSSAEDDDGSPIRQILCVKNKVDVKHFEDVEDCFILDFDPSELVQLFKLSVSDNGGRGHDGSPDIAVVAEKGQVLIFTHDPFVACRDYPHSRHLCLKFPFGTTPHESYCDLCYCYVCDSAAPCGLWKLSHCHAAGHIGDWKSKRMLRKQQAAVKK